MTLFRVDASSTGRRLVATAHIGRGSTVGPLPVERVVRTQQRYSLQIGVDEHADGLGDFVWLNHSCDPSVFVDTAARTVVAIKDLAPGDELTFFYPSTEWQMAEAFDCHCGSAQCIGRLDGAASLPRDVLGRYRLNPHILTLLARR